MESCKIFQNWDQDVQALKVKFQFQANLCILSSLKLSCERLMHHFFHTCFWSCQQKRGGCSDDAVEAFIRRLHHQLSCRFCVFRLLGCHTTLSLPSFHHTLEERGMSPAARCQPIFHLQYIAFLNRMWTTLLPSRVDFTYSTLLP